MIDKIDELNEMRKTCKKEMNKEVNHYPCCFSDYREKGRETRNKRHNDSMKKERTDTITKSEILIGNTLKISRITKCQLATSIYYRGV